MSEYIKIGMSICWGIVAIIWLITAFNIKNPTLLESFIKRIFLYWIPLVVAMLLLGPGAWFGKNIIRENFVPHTNFVGIIGLSFCIIGTWVACWARVILGTNWSLSVQKKEEHRLITTGPYKYVRHPIYTGLLVLFLGNAIIVGDYRGLIAVAIVFISFWFKLKKEEKYLHEMFDEHYLQYKKNTKALIPFVL